MTKDEQAAQSLGINSTPSLIVAGPKGQTKPSTTLLDYSRVESLIKSVS